MLIEVAQPDQTWANNLSPEKVSLSTDNAVREGRALICHWGLDRVALFLATAKTTR